MGAWRLSTFVAYNIKICLRTALSSSFRRKCDPSRLPFQGSFACALMFLLSCVEADDVTLSIIQVKTANDQSMIWTPLTWSKLQPRFCCAEVEYTPDLFEEGTIARFFLAVTRRHPFGPVTGESNLGTKKKLNWPGSRVLNTTIRRGMETLL